jgi:hypothetical protein
MPPAVLARVASCERLLLGKLGIDMDRLLMAVNGRWRIDRPRPEAEVHVSRKRRFSKVATACYWHTPANHQSISSMATSPRRPAFVASMDIGCNAATKVGWAHCDDSGLVALLEVTTADPCA